MSFGAFVLIQETDSDEFVYLPDRHAGAITEIRVEQHLDKQTSFAIRFQEDFDEDAEVEAAQRLFAKSTGVAICVADGPPPVPGGLIPAKLVCLVRGQVENVEFNVSVGGAGSWFEIRGQDVRTLINRSAEGTSITGPSDEILGDLVRPCVSKDPDVSPGIKRYLGEDTTFTFLGTALEAAYDLARKSNYAFWLEHELKTTFDSIARDAVGKFVVESAAFIKASPPRPEDELPGAFEGLDLLPQKADAKLLILGNEAQCETVVNFRSYVDNEVISATKSYAQDIDSGEDQDNEDVRSQASPTNEGGEDPTTVGGPPSGADQPSERTVQICHSGDPELARWQAYAAATEASWYNRAEALTTVHMLQHVLQPHEIIEVEGGGCGIAGKYQVSDVTHVINPAAHWMQVKLRSNSRSLKKTPSVP